MKTGFYVTLRPPGGRWVSTLLGPYETQTAADADTGRAAEEVARIAPSLDGVIGVERAAAIGDRDLLPGVLESAGGARLED